MEVADSHMSEHFPIHAPSHADIDMSGEYYDEEYIMHDATEATNDAEIEIYDAEIDEQPGHDEVEMDEYTDEIVDDNEAHMGTYVSGDDATVTDVTVEDVQLRSSPITSVAPRGVALRPISPHATLDADLTIDEVSVDALATHSPHSVATLIDDSEVDPAQTEGAKEEFSNEVIDLTETDDQTQDWSAETAETAEPEPGPGPELELGLPRNELDSAEQEVYEGRGVPVEVESPEVHLAALDRQSERDGAAASPSATADDAADAPSFLEIPEQPDQGIHSPIEEALVINQQVRDDAADSMEPSPPIRLSYKEEISGVSQTFDIFAPSTPNSQDVQLLFQDNRTLYYESLSAFFVQLRETEYFSGSAWQDAEMELKMNLGTSDLSIGEDHRDTDKISLFNLSSIWTGLGLEGPPSFILQRYAERFSTRYARLVEQVEQGDLQNDETEDLHEVQEETDADANHDVHSGVAGSNIVQREIATGNSNDEGDEDKALGDPQLTEEDPRPHETHEDEGEDGGTAEPSETFDDQLQETNATHDAHNDAHDTEAPVIDPNSQHSVQGPDATPLQENDQNVTLNGPQDVTKNPVSNADLRENGGNPSPHESSLVLAEGDPEVPRDDTYEEYDIEENDLAPQGTGPNGVAASPSEHTEVNDYDEYEDYEGAEDQTTEEQLPTGGPAGSDGTKVAALAAHAEMRGSTSNSSLKRNIEDLDSEKYETPSAPSSPASEYKRIKHT